jgi:hypothetical protein
MVSPYVTLAAAADAKRSATLGTGPRVRLSRARTQIAFTVRYFSLALSSCRRFAQNTKMLTIN